MSCCCCYNDDFDGEDNLIFVAPFAQLEDPVRLYESRY